MDSFELNNNAETPMLTQLFHKHAEETISDEQIGRVLGPILERIDSGELSKTQYETAEPHDKQKFRIYLTEIITSDVITITIVIPEKFLV